MSFSHALSSRFGDAAALFGTQFIKALALPVPGEGEFYETNIHSGKLAKLIVFHQESRLGVRFYDPYTVPFHDHVLQPLAKIEAGRMDIDIVPLVANGIHVEDRDRLTSRLRRDGIEWGDDVPHNAGYLDGEHAVIFDICETLTYGLRRDFNKVAHCPVQDRLFAPLRQAAAQFLTDAHPLPDTDCAARFFDMARAMAKNEPPVFGYIGDDGQSARAAKAALSYNRRCMNVLA